MAWIYQPPADRLIQELGFIEPEDEIKRIIVWKVDSLHKGEEFCGSAVRVAGSFSPRFFPFSGFAFLCLI
jgi:hypothetical protein